MIPFPLFLAGKYLKPKRSMVSIITVLTMLGIALGVAVLVVVLSVMTGFDDVHKEHMIKLDSHLQISARGESAFAYEPVLEHLSTIPDTCRRNQILPMTSTPPIYGRSTSGTTMVPSAC